MAFKIHNANRRKELSLLEIFFNRQGIKKEKNTKAAKLLPRDTVTISNEGKLLEKTQVVSASSNIKLDQSIDLQSCFANARNQNQKVIAAAGDEINSTSIKQYISDFDVCKTALTEKYSKLLQEAKSHSDPEQYIRQKYFDKNSACYASDLSEEERRIAYAYETQMLTNGKIRNVSLGDSLFRGVTLHADAFVAAKKEFDRQMVNSQISNILQEKGIELCKDQKISFCVTPYSYQISVECADDELKSRIENALNVGKNGENLYNHIRSSAICEGITSTQITAEGTSKNQLFYGVSTILELDIRELTEKNGTYYTDEGEDIVKLFSKNIDKMNKTNEQKTALKEWYIELINRVASKGWNNIADMSLSIEYSQSGLVDKYQNYGFGATSREWLENMLETSTFSVM